MKEASNAEPVRDRTELLDAQRDRDVALDSGDGHGLWAAILREDSIIRKYAVPGGGTLGATAVLLLLAHLASGPV